MEGQRWTVRIHKYLSIHLKIDFSYREKLLCINQCIIKMHWASLIASAFWKFTRFSSPSPHFHLPWVWETGVKQKRILGEAAKLHVLNPPLVVVTERRQWLKSGEEFGTHYSWGSSRLCLIPGALDRDEETGFWSQLCVLFLVQLTPASSSCWDKL